MINVFLSYSAKDHFFAELATEKLAQAGIKLWRDQGQLRAGADWRQGIEQAIAESVAVLVALSSSSVESLYVTYEWAYALGKGKAIIPIKLNACTIHQKLEAIQYLDFSFPGTLPWPSLIERIREIDADSEPASGQVADDVSEESARTDDGYVRAILAYLNQRGYQMASFDRLRRRIDENLTNQRLNEIIVNNPRVFRHAILKEGKPGIAKVVP